MSGIALGWAWRVVLPSNDKFVLIALADRADEAGYVFLGQKNLAAKTGMCERTVRSSLKRLETCGAIHREPRFRDDGSRTSDGIFLPVETPPANLAAGNGLPGVIHQSSSPTTTASEEEQQTVVAREDGKLFDEPQTKPAYVINRKVMTKAEWAVVAPVLEAFNAAFRTTFTTRDKDMVSRIVMTVRRWPDLTVADYRRIIDNNAKAPWWKGDATTVGVIFSPGAFPNAMRCDGRPKGGDGSVSPSRRMLDVLGQIERGEHST